MNTTPEPQTLPRVPLLVSVPDAAKLLGVSPRFMRTLIAQGDMPCVRLGRRVLISRAALDALVDIASTPS